MTMSSFLEVLKVRVTKEGLHKINTDGLTLSGRDASNYTLLGETHEVLIQLKAKFKAIKNIENKINELAKSGKKIITGATQAIPKVVAMSSSPSAGPAAGPSLGGGPTGGGGHWLVEVVQEEAVGLEETPVVENHLLKSNFFKFLSHFIQKFLPKFLARSIPDKF